MHWWKPKNSAPWVNLDNVICIERRPDGDLHIVTVRADLVLIIKAGSSEEQELLEFMESTYADKKAQ